LGRPRREVKMAAEEPSPFAAELEKVSQYVVTLSNS
jgi:hypothetical protein